MGCVACLAKQFADTRDRRNLAERPRFDDGIHDQRRDEGARRLRPMRVFVFDRHHGIGDQGRLHVEGRRGGIERRQRVEAAALQILVAAPVGEDAERVDNHHAPQRAPERAR